MLQDFALGGTERIALRLARAWAARGRRVVLFCGSDEGPLRALAGEAVEIVTADPPVPRAKDAVPRLGRAAARYLARNPHRLCFVPGNYHWPVIPHLRRAAPGMAIAAQLSSAIEKPQRRALRQRLFDRRMRRLLDGADALVCLDRQAAAEAASRAPRCAVAVIPLPALDDVAPPLSRAEGRTVMAAGRLVPAKGFDLLVKAFARLDDRTARLMIVGAGPEEARLRGLIAAHGLTDRVAMPGYAADIRPLLEDARLFVLSSRYEGYPAVLVEALASGRPVVATDCTPATGLIADDRFGRVVPVGDPAALAAAIAAGLADPAPDPALLAAAVAHHRIGAVAEAYLALFDGLTGGRAA